MLAEHLRSREQLESLVGRSALEVICLLPTLPLFTELRLSDLFSSKTITFALVEYSLKGPKKAHKEHDEPDVFSLISAVQGEKIDPERLGVNPEPGYATGLISRTVFNRQIGEKRLIPVLDEVAQIPMMDFDIDLKGRPESEVLEIIKRKLHDEVGAGGGLILRSSEKPGHFHFLETDRLLSSAQYLIFLAMCGLMVDEDGEPLADLRFIFHALTALRPSKLGIYGEPKFSELVTIPNVLFTTLKIRSGDPGSFEPVVVDVL